MFLAPLIEKAAIAQGDVFPGCDSQAHGGAVNPFGRTFELCVVADGGLVDDAVAFAIVPLGAPLLVAEGSDKAKGKKDFSEGSAVGDFGFCFDAMLVAVFARTVGRDAFVGDGPAAGVAADAENFSACAHFSVGGVVEDVAFKAARGVERKASALKALGETGQVRNFELDLGLDGHGKGEYTAEGAGSAQGKRRQ